MKRTDSPPVRIEERGDGSTSGDVAAAAALLLVLAATGYSVVKAAAAAGSGQALLLSGRMGERPVTAPAFSLLWWAVLVSGAGGCGYCAYLLFRILERRR